LSLICAALTWLRNYKKNVYEISIDRAAKSFKDEPDWVVEQLLKRKRAEIVDLWEERESNLRKIRAKEAMMEEREKKRRRYAQGSSGKDVKDRSDDDGEEWLLDEEDDENVPRFSDTGKKETDDSNEEDQVKVDLTHSTTTQPWLTKVIDILHVKDAFSVDPIYCRTTPTDIPVFGAR
jgi:Rad3-related DNA helicase